MPRGCLRCAATRSARTGGLWPRHLPESGSVFPLSQSGCEHPEDIDAALASELEAGFTKTAHASGAGRYSRIYRRDALLPGAFLARWGVVGLAGWLAPSCLRPINVLRTSLRKSARLVSARCLIRAGPIAQPHGQIAQPSFMADAPDGRALGFAQVRFLHPTETALPVCICQPMRGLKSDSLSPVQIWSRGNTAGSRRSRKRGCPLRVASSGRCCRGAQWSSRKYSAGIQFEGPDKGIGGAQVQAGGASAAVFALCGCVSGSGRSV